MMIPEFMRFYPYTVQQAMNEYAVTFFSLINSMYRLKANEALEGIMIASTSAAGKDGQSTIDELDKQAKGIHGIVQEVRAVKKVRGR